MNILDKFGFKEVCDVCLYEINESTGEPTKPVLFLDTLKVSTVETTCQQTDATGGYGNNVLLTWDYGKDIIVNFTDALFSMKSLAILNGVNENAIVDSENGIVRQAIQFTGIRKPLFFKGPNGKQYSIPSGTEIIYDEFGEIVSSESLLEPNQKYFLCFTLSPRHLQGVSINSNNFPGVYYMIGDTIARNYSDNSDEFCRFVIPKMKIYSEFNFDLSGTDPSVFSFRGRALSTGEKQMMSLIKYDMDEMAGAFLNDVQNVNLYSSIDERLLVRF